MGREGFFRVEAAPDSEGEHAALFALQEKVGEKQKTIEAQNEHAH